MVKDTQWHPVRNEAVHIDFVRVRMDVAIQSIVTLELVGADDSPGIDEGGVLEQQLREVNVEALPGDIPESDPARRLEPGDGRDRHVADLAAVEQRHDPRRPRDASSPRSRCRVSRSRPTTPRPRPSSSARGEEAPEGEAAEGDGAEGGDAAGDAESPDSTSE